MAARCCAVWSDLTSGHAVFAAIWYCLTDLVVGSGRITGAVQIEFPISEHNRSSPNAVG